MFTASAAAKGVKSSRRNARLHASELHEEARRLRKTGFKTYTAIAEELHRLGFRGRRGGRITRERLYEMRQRLGKF